MRRFFVGVLFILSIGMPLFAENGTRCCVCQYGDDNPIESPWLKMGCAVWLLEHTGCYWRRVDPYTGYGEIELPQYCEGGILNVGYVGHWGGGYQTANGARLQLIPTAQKYHVAIRYDNTGCDVLDNADYVQSVLSPYRDLDIEIQGSQVMTIGMGDKILMPVTKVGTQFDQPQYPPCQKIAESSCMYFLHRYESVKCQDNGKFRTLSCCQKTTTREVRDSDHITPREEKHTEWLWTDRCGP